VINCRFWTTSVLVPVTEVVQKRQFISTDNFWFRVKDRRLVRVTRVRDRCHWSAKLHIFQIPDHRTLWSGSASSTFCCSEWSQSTILYRNRDRQTSFIYISATWYAIYSSMFLCWDDRPHSDDVQWTGSKSLKMTVQLVEAGWTWIGV